MVFPASIPSPIDQSATVPTLLLSIKENEPWERESVRRLVHRRAIDRDDEHMLVEMLGLRT